MGDRERQPRQREGRRAGRDRASPAPILKQGLVLVDTPGMGGLGAGHAAATPRVPPVRRRRDPRVRRVGGAERTRGRLPARASELCPTVLFVADEDRPLPVVAPHPRPEPWPPRAQRCTRPGRRGLERAAARGARPQGPRSQRTRQVPRADQGARRGSRHPREGAAAERSAGDVHAIVRSCAPDSRRSSGCSRTRHADRDPRRPRAGEGRGSSSSAARAPAGARSSATASPTSPTTSRSGSARRCATSPRDGRADREAEQRPRSGTRWCATCRRRSREGVTQAFVSIEKAFGDVEAEVVELLQEEQLGAARSGRAATTAST